MKGAATQRDLDVASSIALEAAALVRRYRGHDMTVHRKAENEPVTEADHAASELIVRLLREAFPDDAILSEELPDDGSRRRLHRAWMIDPIDGTKDFIRGETGFAVMIGLCVDGQPRAGVVAAPALGRTFTGLVRADGRGGQAWVEEPDGARHALRVSDRSGPPGLRMVASKSHKADYITSVAASLGVTDVASVGSVGLKVSLVSEGERDFYVYPGDKTKIWDACAPQAILVAAGGRMTDVDGRPLDYQAEGLTNPRGIVASNGTALHDLVLGAVAPFTGPPAR